VNHNVDDQQQESSEIKNHDEILRLFKELEVMQEKVKNPQEFVKEIIQSQAFLQKMEPTNYSPKQTIEQQPSMEPILEIPQKEEEKQRRLFRIKDHKLHHKAQQEITQTDQQEQEVTTPRSTFILQLDENGNLVGLPIKKPKFEKENKQKEEQVKDIKGKLKHIGFLLHRMNASEEESSEGIGGKIRGIFRRD